MATSTTTAAAVRDRAIAAIEALAPSSVAEFRFKRYLAERDADFIKYISSAPQASLRRFFVRISGSDPPPAFTNGDVEEHEVTLDVWVAYPQTSITGKYNAQDRDRVMDEDRKKILKAIGLNGRANFSSATNPAYPDACWRSSEAPPFERGQGVGVDLVVLRVTLSFQMTT